MRKVLVCGSRHWPLKWGFIVSTVLRHNLTDEDVVVCGGAIGVDNIAAESAKEYNLKLEEFPAEWSKYGRAAGPIRNTKMLRSLSEGDEIWAFYLKGVISRGTNDMVRQARGMYPVLKIVLDQETGEVEHYKTPANKEKSSG